MENLTISFIGGGNMARSLIGGLTTGSSAPRTIYVADPNSEQLDILQKYLPIKTTQSNIEAAAVADILILAVKPQVLMAVAAEISATLQSRKDKPLVISIAAGIREADLNRWLGNKLAIIRTMPNTPALIQTGATALYANELCTDEQHNCAESIMRTVGLTLWIDNEDLMDAVTAVSGSGPAYFFLFMEAMENAGRNLGLSADDARLLTLQTALGAAKMALESPEDCATLRARVTSPGGTTEQAINTFEAGQLRELVNKALTAASNRSAELAKQLGDK
jgi:pyrroline-5-carboxylate reductase